MTDIVAGLRSNSALPICPFDKRSPEYWTTPNDKPCKFCGSEPEGTDKCTGADMRIMIKAADEIERLRLSLSEARATGRREGLSEAAEIAQHVDLFDGDKLKNSDPRETCATAIRAAMEKAE